MIWASTRIFGRCHHVHRSRTSHLQNLHDPILCDLLLEGRSTCHDHRSDGSRCRTTLQTSWGMVSDTTTRRPSLTAVHQRICIVTMDATLLVAALRRVNAPTSRRWLHRRGRVWRSRYGCVPFRRRRQHWVEGMYQTSLANNACHHPARARDVPCQKRPIACSACMAWLFGFLRVSVSSWIVVNILREMKSCCRASTSFT